MADGDSWVPRPAPSRGLEVARQEYRNKKQAFEDQLGKKIHKGLDDGLTSMMVISKT